MSRTIPRPSEAVAAAAPAEDVPYPLTKRVFDRTVAALLLVVLSPLLALAFALLAVDMLLVPRDRGRWLYRERRISRGREFEVLKFGVLRGDISLVGPRPWPVTMVETQVAKGFDYRLHVMAGWTGPAQVRKDSKAKSKATELDLEYVELCRTLTGPQLVRHDLKVIRQSLRTVLRARGLRY